MGDIIMIDLLNGWICMRSDIYKKNGNCAEKSKNSIILMLRDFETISILFDDDGFLQKINKKST